MFRLLVALALLLTLGACRALKNFDLMGMRFGPHNVAPPMTLLGVTRLAIPGLLFEIEAVAAG